MPSNNIVPSFNDLKEAVTRIAGPYTSFAYLVGSAATARFNTNSDIDIAVYWHETNFKDKNKILEVLVDEFNRDVDLISLNNIDVIYSMQVLESGRLLYCHDPGLLLEWQAKQLSAYPDFKRTRSGIEDNILRRKKYV